MIKQNLSSGRSRAYLSMQSSLVGLPAVCPVRLVPAHVVGGRRLKNAGSNAMARELFRVTSEPVSRGEAIVLSRSYLEH